MKKLVSFSTAIKSFAFVTLCSLAACQNAATSVDVDKTKEEITSSTDPKTVPGTNDQQTVSSQDATDANNSTATTKANGTAKIEFEKKLHDFGTIKEGEKGTYVFKFKNTGDKPLIISNAQGSCGCTVPTYPREPIAPGKSGEINVVFDSKGKPGAQSKKVTITANTDPEQTIVEIKANVIGKDVNTK